MGYWRIKFKPKWRFIRFIFQGAKTGKDNGFSVLFDIESFDYGYYDEGSEGLKVMLLFIIILISKMFLLATLVSSFKACKLVLTYETIVSHLNNSYASIIFQKNFSIFYLSWLYHFHFRNHIFTSTFLSHATFTNNFISPSHFHKYVQNSTFTFTWWSCSPPQHADNESCLSGHFHFYNWYPTFIFTIKFPFSFSQVAIVHHLDMPIMRQRAFHIAPGTENQIPITPTLYTANPQVNNQFIVSSCLVSLLCKLLVILACNIFHVKRNPFQFFSMAATFHSSSVNLCLFLAFHRKFAGPWHGQYLH